MDVCLRKICIVFHTPIIESYRSLFKFDDFIERGYQLILLDISAFTNHAAYKLTQTGLIDYRLSYVHRIMNYKELFRVLERCHESIFIMTFDCNVEFYPLYHYLARYRIKYGYMVLGANYQTSSILSNRERIKAVFCNISIIRVANGLFRRLPRERFGISPCSFVINNSPVEIDHFRKRFVCAPSTRFKVIHSNFYEEALMHKNEPRLIREKYCVWLDFYAPYHPDVEMTEKKNPMNPDRYYRPLRKFFHWVEEYTGYKVIIAAHPRSDYSLHSEAYEGYRVEKFNTCMLVRDSEFVMTTASSSFLYAIMYSKPLLFLIQDELYSLPDNVAYAENVSQKLNKSPIYIEHIEQSQLPDLFDQELKIDEKTYKKSANEYIKEGFDGTISGNSHISEIIDLIESVS